jgi:hypothetical protein
MPTKLLISLLIAVTLACLGTSWRADMVSTPSVAHFTCYSLSCTCQPNIERFEEASAVFIGGELHNVSANPWLRLVPECPFVTSKLFASEIWVQLLLSNLPGFEFIFTLAGELREKVVHFCVQRQRTRPENWQCFLIEINGTILGASFVITEGPLCWAGTKFDISLSFAAQISSATCLTWNPIP